MALRIIFFGTSKFALPSLDAIADSVHQIEGIVTAPDAIRRGVPMTTPVRQWAHQKGVEVVTPPSPHDARLLKWLHDKGADLFLVIAYKKLPPQIWKMPPNGTVNLHASLLPDYRGAAPIHHAIIAGESWTGVTTFYITHGIDTGDIIFQEKVAIEPDETFGSLHDKLATVGARLVIKTLDAIANSTAPRHPQRMKSVKKAPKLTKAFCRIQWQQPAELIDRMVRGLSPMPGAWTMWGGRQVRILGGRPCRSGHPLLPGHFRVKGRHLEVGTGTPEYVYQVSEIHFSGKRPMATADAICGRLLAREGVFG